LRILIFDSGLGGLTVMSEIRKALPGAEITYLADIAVFPYGGLAEPDLVARVVDLMDAEIPRRRPDAIVIACATASTLVLPPLRARFDIPIVGTVPAVKPAAERSRSRMATVLATPGTVKRDYTHALIREHGQDVRFNLVGSPRLAPLAQGAMMGEAVSDADIAAEIAPTFVEEEGRRTDIVVLACTHYPLLLDRFRRLAPWPVEWIDPAPAIARRTANVLAERGIPADVIEPRRDHVFVSTADGPPAALLEAYGFRPGTAAAALTSREDAAT
jgi:glutamate racemase